MTAVVYMAHPVSGDVDGNIKRALAWLRWLRRREPDVAIIAPWIAAILSGEDDGDPAQRERGLRDCRASAEVCDGIVLVGNRISAGMQAELDAVCQRGGWVADLTVLRETTPPATANLTVQVFGHDYDMTPLEWGRRMWEAP